MTAVLLPLLTHRRRIFELDVFGEPKCPVDKLRLQLVDLTLTRFTQRQFVRRSLSQWNVSSGPVGWNLTRVDFVRQIAVDNPLGPRRGSRRSILGINAGDSSDHPVGVAKIE